MSALVYDYKSIAAHMKGELAPRQSHPCENHEITLLPLSDEYVRRLKLTWELDAGEIVPVIVDCGD